MGRSIVAALAAIAVLAAGGVFLVLVVEREGAPAPTVRVTPGVPPPPPPRGAGVSTGPPPLAVAPPPMASPAAPSAGTSPAVEVMRRAREFSIVRREAVTGLSRLDPQVLACGLRVPRMLVTLESQDGHLRVVHAKLAEPDPAASEGAGWPPERTGARECAVRAVEGAMLDAPSARPGRQWEMEYAPGAMQELLHVGDR